MGKQVKEMLRIADIYEALKGLIDDVDSFMSFIIDENLIRELNAYARWKFGKEVIKIIEVNGEERYEWDKDFARKVVRSLIIDVIKERVLHESVVPKDLEEEFSELYDICDIKEYGKPIWGMIDTDEEGCYDAILWTSMDNILYAYVCYTNKYCKPAYINDIVKFYKTAIRHYLIYSI